MKISEFIYFTPICIWFLMKALVLFMKVVLELILLYIQLGSDFPFVMFGFS